VTLCAREKEVKEVLAIQISRTKELANKNIEYLRETLQSV
jgi:hypothetical protein